MIYAKTRYVLISNPDVIYETDFFDNLKKYIDLKYRFYNVYFIGPIYRSKRIMQVMDFLRT